MRPAQRGAVILTVTVKRATPKYGCQFAPAEPETCPACFSIIDFVFVALTIQLQPSAQQSAFNLKRWAELLADPELARLPHRIETDRHGHILMRPPPAPKHGNFQSEIAHILRSLLSSGRVITECPLSTSDGVKALDVAWLKPGRAEELRSMVCLVRAPEICVEVPGRLG